MNTGNQEIEELQDVTLIEESKESLEQKATEDAIVIASQESKSSEVIQIDSAKESIEKLKQFTEEDENKNSSSSSLRSILGGDFLTAKMVRGQLGLIILIAIFFIFYINNRYKNQAELIEIDNLKKELDDARFRALTRSSELTSRSRQSYIEDYLRSNKDSLLQISSSSPFVIKLNGESILPVHKDETLTLEELKNLPDSIIE